MSIGDVMGSAWTTLRRRPGQFLLLTVLPLVGILIAMIPMIATSSEDRSGASTPSLPGVLGTIALSVPAMLITYRCLAMMVAAVRDEARGRTSKLGELWRDTSGVLVPIVLLVLLGAGVAIVVTVVVFVLMSLLDGATRDGRGTSAVVGFVLILLYLAFLVTSAILSVRLLYVIQALTLEKLGAIDALKRSWALTRGQFWRTFGYSLVMGLVAYLITMVLMMVALGFVLAASASAEGDAPLGPVGAIIMTVVGIPMTVAYLLLMAWENNFSTVLYLDQLARTQALTGQPQPVLPELQYKPSPYAMAPYGGSPQAPYSGQAPYGAQAPYQGQVPPQGSGLQQGQSPYGVPPQQPYPGGTNPSPYQPGSQAQPPVDPTPYDGDQRA